jgi:hypothetical protein
MIDDMYDVMNRINEIRKRFANITKGSQAHYTKNSVPFKEQFSSRINVSNDTAKQKTQHKVRDSSFADKLLNSIELQNKVQRHLYNRTTEGSDALEGIYAGGIVPKAKILDILKEIVKESHSQNENE